MTLSFSATVTGGKIGREIHDEPEEFHELIVEASKRMNEGDCDCLKQHFERWKIWATESERNYVICFAEAILSGVKD